MRIADRLAHAVVLFALAASGATAQDPQTPAASPPVSSAIHRFEIGWQSAQIRTYCVGPVPNCTLASFAVGVSGAINLKRFLALDAGYLVTPSSGGEFSNQYGGRITEVSAGARLEARAAHVGYFVEAQPGFLSWHHVITGVTFPTPNSLLFSYGETTHFVSQVGPGVEYSPSSRIHMRVQLTDLVYRYSSSSWSNYFQPSASVTYGFGTPLAWAPPQHRGARTPYLTPLNGALLAGTALAIAADAITTQRFIAHGYIEGDPIARPLVKYGCSGQIAASSLELGAETWAIYGLHRIGHRWMEHLLPVGIAIPHAILAYNNTKVSSKPPPTPFDQR